MAKYILKDKYLSNLVLSKCSDHEDGTWFNIKVDQGTCVKIKNVETPFKYVLELRGKYTPFHIIININTP